VEDGEQVLYKPPQPLIELSSDEGVPLSNLVGEGTDQILQGPHHVVIQEDGEVQALGGEGGGGGSRRRKRRRRRRRGLHHNAGVCFSLQA